MVEILPGYWFLYRRKFSAVSANTKPDDNARKRSLCSSRQSARSIDLRPNESVEAYAKTSCSKVYAKAKHWNKMKKPKQVRSRRHSLWGDEKRTNKTVLLCIVQQSHNAYVQYMYMYILYIYITSIQQPMKSKGLQPLIASYGSVAIYRATLIYGGKRKNRHAQAHR